MTFSFKKVFLAAAVMFVFMGTVFAQENKITSVSISKSKDIADGYELTIDSTESASYKTKIINDNNIIFELKNSVLEEDLGTFYNDVNDIDSVTVKQSAANRVRIYIQGQNVKNTELIFVNSLFEADEKASKKITLSQPINQYQSTNHLSEDEMSQDWNDNSFNMSQLLSTTLGNLKEGNAGLIVIILAIIALGAYVLKSIAKKYEQDSEPLIGLNNNYSAPLNQNETLKNRSETIKNAQKELQKAHQKYQEYIQNKYKTTKKPSVGIDSIKKGIALSQYQKSTINPYDGQEVIKMEDFSQKEPKENLFGSQKSETYIPQRPKMRPQNFTSPYIKRGEEVNENLFKAKTYTGLKSSKAAFAGEAPAASKAKTGSINFLESVTKIYEQSGRLDLANDLKNKMIKARK